MNGRGQSPNEHYLSDLAVGFKSLVRIEIHNKANMLKNESVRAELLKEEGFLFQYNSERDNLCSDLEG